MQRSERFSFYEGTEQAFATVMTSETVEYRNIILKKGVALRKRSRYLMY
jgi:L-fucose mutarotase/ribose pyranase (RbsD/FucU family)